jgi:hypothetical protein
MRNLVLTKLSLERRGAENSLRSALKSSSSFQEEIALIQEVIPILPSDGCSDRYHPVDDICLP